MERLSRRALLRRGLAGAGVAGIAGCAGRGGGETADRPTRTTSGTPPADAIRRVGVESVTERSELAGMDVSIQVVEPYATPKHPPRIRVTFENTGSRPALVRTHHSGLVWPPYSEDGPPGLALGPESERVPRGEGTCWQAHGTITPLGTSRNFTLDPGERRSEELVVLGHPENDDVCLPTGTFRLVDQFPSVCRDGECQDWTIEFMVRVSEP